MKRLILIVVNLVVLSFMGSAAFADTPKPIFTVGTNYVDNFCLEVDPAGKTLFINKCSGKPEQELVFEKGDSGKLRHGDMCAGVAGHGMPLVLKQCENTDEFDWGFNENGTMSNLKSDCADILNFKSDIGTPVIAWDCTATDNQKFFPKKVTLVQKDNGAAATIAIKGTPSIGSYYTQGQCLEETIAGSIIINNCNAGKNQTFHFVKGNFGQLTNGNKCLASKDKGVPLVVKTCAETKEQQWVFKADGTLGNGLNLCADIFTFQTRPGTDVIAWDCTATENQKFYPAIAAQAANINLGATYANAILANEGITTVSVTPTFSASNLTGAAGAKISADAKGNLKGGLENIILVGGAGVYTKRFVNGLVSQPVKDSDIAKTAILPSKWDFFSGENSGSITIEK